MNKNYIYNVLYKTTNNITGDYYIGMHSTNNLKDGYLGSGSLLKQNIVLYGKENFTIEYLKFFSDRKSLDLAEREVINKELLLDIKCLNKKEGGEDAGWTPENRRKGALITNAKLWKDPNFVARSTKRINKAREEAIKNRNFPNTRLDR